VKTTILEDIKKQQRLVKELEHKSKVSDDEYWRLTTLRNQAMTAQSEASETLSAAKEKLKEMGSKFALDLSEIDYTPPMTDNKL
jgi:hypothetical protein